MKEACRIPAGSPDAGQFTSCGEAGGSAAIGEQPRAKTDADKRIDRATELIRDLTRAAAQGDSRKDAAKALIDHLSTMKLGELRALRGKLDLRATARSRDALVQRFKDELSKNLGISLETGKTSFGKSEAKVQVGARASAEMTLARIKQVLGPDATLHDVASLVGAPKEAKVQVEASTWSPNRLSVAVIHPAFDASRTIDIDDKGDKFIHNSTFFLNPDAKRGRFGREMYGRQIENAAAAGFKYIDVNGIGSGPPDPEKARDPGVANGYYTWARFGFDTPIKDMGDIATKIKGVFPDAKNLSDVMQAKDVKLPEKEATTLRDTLAANDKALGREPRDRAQIRGSDWWLMNGRSFSGVFDLTPGSRSMRMFDAYLAETEKVKAAKAAGFEAGDFDDDDALDRAWDRIDLEDRAAEMAEIVGGALGDDAEEFTKGVKHNECHDEQGRFCSDTAGKPAAELTREEYAARSYANESPFFTNSESRGRTLDQAAAALRGAGGSQRDVDKLIELWAAGHREHVRHALENGQHVPQRVLDQYPELAHLATAGTTTPPAPKPQGPVAEHQARLNTSAETPADVLASTLMGSHQDVAGKPLTDADREKYLQAAHDYFGHAQSFFGKVNAGDKTALRVVADATRSEDAFDRHRPDLAYASEMVNNQIGAHAAHAAEQQVDVRREARGEVQPAASVPPEPPPVPKVVDLEETAHERGVRESKERVDNANRLIYRVRYASRGSQGANSSSDFHELADHLATMSATEIRSAREQSNIPEFKGRSKEALVGAIVGGLRAARERMYGAGKALTKDDGDDLHAQAEAMADLLGGLLPEEALAYGMIWAGSKPGDSKAAEVCHLPAGSATGGQFTSCGGGEGDSSPSTEVKPEHKAEVDRLTKSILGPNATHDDVAKMVGAGPGAKVSITPNSSLDRLTVTIDHPDYKAARTIDRDADGKGRITNEWITVPEGKQGDGIGRELFARQVDEATKAGFDRIECRASKSDEHNGFYSWPRMGYNAPLDGLPNSTQQAIASKFPEAKSVLDVMASPGGTKWWKANGETLAHATFDLGKDSRSQKVLAAYVKEKATRAPAGVISSIGRLFGLTKGAYNQSDFSTLFVTQPG